VVSGGLHQWLCCLEMFDESGHLYRQEIVNLISLISVQISKWAPEIYRWWLPTQSKKHRKISQLPPSFGISAMALV
jgi:hypothetical protein